MKGKATEAEKVGLTRVRVACFDDRNDRRAVLRTEILVEILIHFCKGGRGLFVMEDCQWLDVSSWKLFREVLLRVRPLFVVATCRTMCE